MYQTITKNYIMKNLIIYLLTLVAAANISAQVGIPATHSDARTGAITVEVTGLDSDEGQVMIALYDSSENWLKKNILGKASPIKNGSATVVFEGLTFGTYAVSTFHDEDNSGKLETGIFGIPKEPYASSRGAKGMFGPPQWKDAIFEVNMAAVTESVKY